VLQQISPRIKKLLQAKTLNILKINVTRKVKQQPFLLQIDLQQNHQQFQQK
jgi:hypothetical protein